MIKYNLFLDDERFPFVDETQRKKLGKYASGYDYIDMVSTYNYTKFEPFKTEEWVIVRNYKEFVSYITEHGLPTLISFDHDLADVHYLSQKIINYEKFQEKTGYDCAKWLCDYCQEHNLKIPEYYIHSMNEVGKQNIYSYIENYKKHVEND
jgi:REP element-mobilizing transposase RayT